MSKGLFSTAAALGLLACLASLGCCHGACRGGSCKTGSRGAHSYASSADRTDGMVDDDVEQVAHTEPIAPRQAKCQNGSCRH
jgi:hypothetical protein